MSDMTVPVAVVRSTRRPMRVVSDSLTMAVRCVRMSSRDLDSLLTSLMLPIMLMVLFVYLFGGAIHTGTRYVTYVVPGVLLLCAGFGASVTAVSVNHDMTRGIIDRFRSMDIGGATLPRWRVPAFSRPSPGTVLMPVAPCLAHSLSRGHRLPRQHVVSARA